MTTAFSAQSAPNLYQMIHKSVRLNLCEYLHLLGQSDAADASDRHRLIAEWTRLKNLLDNHAHHEDTFIHPLIERADINVAMTLCAQHTDFDHVLAAIDKALLGLESLGNAIDQRHALQAVYLDYSVMLADYFRHLIIEETKAMPALAAHFSVGELMAAHGRLIASIPPEELLASMGQMARSLSLPELIMLMKGTQASAPPAFMAAVLKQVEGAVSPLAFDALNRALTPQAASQAAPEAA